MIDSSRLPNSMKPWMPISGVATREASVHSGQVGQPRPDDVSRTAPPVPTMSTWVTKVEPRDNAHGAVDECREPVPESAKDAGEGAAVPVTFASLGSDPAAAFRFPGSPG